MRGSSELFFREDSKFAGTCNALGCWKSVACGLRGHDEFHGALFLGFKDLDFSMRDVNSSSYFT